MHLMAIAGDLQMMLTTGWDWLVASWGVVTQAAASNFVTSLWQGMVVAAGLAVFLRLAPRVSAAHRFAVWAAGFGVAAALPFLPFLLRLVDTHSGGVANAGDVVSNAAQVSAHPLLQLDVRWSVAIACVWLAGSTLRLLDLLIHSLRLRKLWQSATPIEIEGNLAVMMADSVHRRVEICTSKKVERPSVIGFRAPRILIPEWLLARLTPGELEQIVLHEAEHLRRRDDWSNLLQKLLLIVFPLNPALWWMERRMCGEREMACDEAVVRATNAPRAYATCLANLAERGLERRAEALSLGAWQRRSDLVGRVHRILERKQALSGAATGALMGALGCALAVGSVELARSPQIVAFVPTQTNAEAHLAAQAGQSGFAGDRVVATEKRHLAPGFYAVEAKAVIPQANQARLAPAKIGARDERPVRKTGIAVRMTPQIDASDDSSELKGENGEQQFLVLTTWEVVESSTSVNQQSADSDAGSSESLVANNDEGQANETGKATGQATGQGTGPTTNHVTRQFTITSLILRIVPASSVSTQPAAGSASRGWFVIQL
jgi:beta-lactamase regulating signal transducer with metallopeptidase domain